MLDPNIIGPLSQALRSQESALVSDPPRLKSLLRDVCGGHKRECNLLINSVDAGVPQGLLNGSGPLVVRQDRFRKKLVDDYPLTQEMADWAVEAWTRILRLEQATASEPLPPIVDETPPPPVTEDSRQEIYESDLKKEEHEEETKPIPAVRPKGALFVALALVIPLVIGILIWRLTQQRDPRDKVVGSYKSEITGNLAYTKLGDRDKDMADLIEKLAAGNITFNADGTFLVDGTADKNVYRGTWTVDRTTKRIDMNLKSDEQEGSPGQKNLTDTHKFFILQDDGNLGPDEFDKPEIQKDLYEAGFPYAVFILRRRS